MIVANKGKIKTMAENLSESGAGRSLWKDARIRFMQNKAATISLFILLSIVLFSFIGPYFAVWSYEQIDWDAMGSAARVGMPSIESGHFFGTDDLGRDLYSRVIQGTQISLMVGVLGATVAVIVGTIWRYIRLFRWENGPNHDANSGHTNVNTIHVCAYSSSCCFWKVYWDAIYWNWTSIMAGYE